MTYKVTLSNSPAEPRLYHGVGRVQQEEGQVRLYRKEDDQLLVIYAPGAWLSVELVPSPTSAELAQDA